MSVHKIITFVLVFSILSISNTQASEGIWSKEIETIMQKNGIANDQYGMEIRNLSGDKIYFSANSKQSFNPASTIKLLISIIALEKLGPQYKFQTQLKKQGKDLCLVGLGDPSLVYEDLFLMVEEFLRSPSFEKKSIDNIIIDESFFPTTRQYNDEFEDDSQRSFTAPLSSVSLNYNSVTIFVKPGTVGNKPFIYTEPRSTYFVIHNQAKTVSAGSKTIGVNVETKPDKVEISVSGQIPIQDNGSIIYRAVTEPSIYAGYILKDQLIRAGVTVTGSLQKMRCTPDAAEIVTYKSKPLSQIMMGMNKFSNNFIAETLLYHLGEQPTSQSGLDKMIAWSKQKSLPLENVKIQNASGLSRDNSLTPIFLWELLSYGKNSFQISPELMASLPIAGLDGTLKRRFHGDSTTGNIRAKSGSLKNTVSLVGSIQTAQKGELLFAFLFKTQGKTMQQIQLIEEKILEKVVALGKN